MKKLISIALVICLAFAAIGCTAATTPEATAPAAAEQAPAAAEQAAATEPAAGTEEKPVAEEKRVLKFLCIYDESKKELYECFDKWRAQHPDVDLQITAITSSSELTKQLTTMAIGNDLPDLVSLDRMYIAEFTEMGIFEDITDRANSDLDLSKFYQGTIDGCTVDGKLYGMPFVANCLAVYYNKDILKANGVAEPADGWTWDDYSAIAQSCANDKEGIYGAIMAGQASTDGTFQYMPWLWMAGGDVYNPANAEPFKTSLNYLSGLIASGAMTPEISNWSQTDASNQFSAGKSALFTGGTWHLTSFKKNIADFEWGVIHYPANPATGEYNTCLGGHGLAICKGGNVDDAWDLIKYIESDEVMGYWNEAQNYIPCRSDIAEASEYFMGDSLISAYTESMAHAKSRGGSNVYIQIDTVIQSMIQEVYTGTMTVDEAVDHYLAEIKSIVG